MRPAHGQARRRRASGPRPRRGFGRFAAALLAGVGSVAAGAGPAAAIVGGTAVYQGEYPFMVSLRESGYPYCGGTLVAPQWVLTAAHCVTGRSLAILTAVVNQSARNGTAGQTLHVDRTAVDPNYDPDTENYDVALVHLAGPVAGVVPVTIDQSGSGDSSSAQPGTAVLVLGYGSADPEDVNGNGPIAYPPTLEQTSVTIDRDRTCTDVFNGTQEPAARTDLMLCAGGDGQHDACVGDSGGPALVPGGQAGWTQIGVVSWGAGCAVRGVPGVYTRISDEQINAFVRNTTGR